VTATADGELVLIVEDNDKSRKLFRELLQLHGFRTLDAKAGAEGIALALEHRPRVVLMDIQLPDIDGVASLRLLRTAPEPYEGPVVAVTAYAMTSDAARFLKHGFDGYISKPIDITEFPRIVRGYCAVETTE